ncbi:MAG: 2-amino-4-hydroxy-6-hydroxymethyldihydropteridine diphosphokinase [Muribaculaceae bacterium]|nr:2-amino-4-hydroxy-6-hydroxymethyldihydropteridine diphosphokinase [Muribaculaceae bacterium]
MPVVYANLGSNLGNRRAFIETALIKISEDFGVCCISSFIETEPWGYESANRFLNLGVSFKSEDKPEDILFKLQRIEKSICAESHRDVNGGYKDRVIDIDIMAIDDIVLETQQLILPHKHLKKREFFLIPLKELNPEWKFPKRENSK